MDDVGLILSLIQWCHLDAILNLVFYIAKYKYWVATAMCS